VHPAIDLRARLSVSGLANGEGVDVGPKPGRGCVSDVDPASGPWSTVVELDSLAFDESAYQVGGPVLVMCRLGIPVE